MAFELSEKTWKLVFTTGHGQKPRERHVPARHQERILDVRKLVTMRIRSHQDEDQVWQVLNVPSVDAEDQRH